MVPSLSTGASAPATVSVSSKLESVRMRRFLGVLTFLAVAAPIGPTAQPAAPIAPLRAATSADLAAGKRMFDSQCAWCHGTSGAGGTGPLLQRATLRHAADDKALADIVRNGIPGTEMPSFAIALTEHTA